jgi:hypothetical protein
MHAFTESSHPGFAEIARTHVASAAKRPEPTRIVEYCSDPANRPHGQELVNLWVTLARRSFALVDAPHDARALALGLKSQSAADLDRAFCERLQPFLRRSGHAVRYDDQRLAYLRQYRSYPRLESVLGIYVLE